MATTKSHQIKSDFEQAKGTVRLRHTSNSAREGHLYRPDDFFFFFFFFFICRWGVDAARIEAVVASTEKQGNAKLDSKRRKQYR